MTSLPLTLSHWLYVQFVNGGEKKSQKFPIYRIIVENHHWSLKLSSKWATMSMSTKIIISVTLFATVFDIYYHRITIPSCTIAFPNPIHALPVPADSDHNSQDFTAILVSDLLLSGSDSSYFDVFFRDYFLSQFFEVFFTLILWILPLIFLLFV